MSALRVGVIGTGAMGVEHIHNILALPGAILTAVADPYAASLHAGVETSGIEDLPTFSNHRALTESGLCDAVVIATPNMTHIDLLMDVMPTDLHVLIEKPLCTTVDDCRRVLEADGRRAAITWVGMEYRFMPSIARLIAEVDAGTIGELKMLSIREHRFPFLVKVGDWNRFNDNTGGTLVEKCCHYFDLMNRIVGAEPLRVFASGDQAVNHLDEVYGGQRPDIIDNAYVIVDYPDGQRAMLDLCMFAEGGRNKEEVVAVGPLGKLEAHNPSGEIAIGLRDKVWFSPSIEVVSDDRIGYAGHHHGSSYLELLHFVDAVQSGAGPAVTVEDGLRSVAMGVAAHQSIESGRPVLMADVL